MVKKYMNVKKFEDIVYIFCNICILGHKVGGELYKLSTLIPVEYWKEICIL